MNTPTVSFEHSEKLNRTTIGAELDGVVRFIVLKGLWRETDGPDADHYADLVTKQVQSAVRERDRLNRTRRARNFNPIPGRQSFDYGMGLVGAAAGLLLGRGFRSARR